ncbi:hypothetical protein GGR56DRAFT_217079 [Xylariaceae sp. FL0804]|nr:hypothetical protein GGR56DRAFT_217079 [Xylariaceae sp. FL0804]
MADGNGSNSGGSSSTTTTTALAAPPPSLRLAQSAYNSPYSRAGAPSMGGQGPGAAGAAAHPNGADPYAELRRRALADLEAMGYDPTTMAEHGVLWAEDQDPYGHVMHSQYMHWAGSCLYRIMEGYDAWLSRAECDDMINGRGVIVVVQKYELEIRRQVRYPDCIIAAHQQGLIEPPRNNGLVSLYSLRQQAVVANVRGFTTYLNAQTGRPVDIRQLGGGWPAVYQGVKRKADAARARKEQWDRDNPPKQRQQQKKKKEALPAPKM